jgi:Ca2+-binding RTX toxin-like protein
MRTQHNLLLTAALAVLILAAFDASPASAACSDNSCAGQICTICGTGAGETITGTGAADVICGLAGDDTIRGGNGNDTICGGTGADMLQGENGTDELYGEGGNDTLICESLGALDTEDGGPGTDTTQCDEDDGCIVDLAAGSCDEDTLVSIENATGSNGFGDTLSGNSGANVLNGRGGADTLDGRAGADTLTCGTGTDTISYQSSATGVTATLPGPLPGGDTSSACENLTGSNFNDVLTGSGGPNTINGLSGEDDIDGAGNTDICNGGPPSILMGEDICINCETETGCEG